MERWRGLDGIPAAWGRSVVTFGMYDGVHRGHRVIIGRAVDLAREHQQPCVVVTFDPHPSEVVRPGTHPALLTTTRFKADLLESLGVDAVLVVPFTQELSQWSPEQFMGKFAASLTLATVVVGDNFTFGYRRTGTVTTLRQMGESSGFTVEGVSLLQDNSGITLSSTAVRGLIAEGAVAAAAEALARDHRVEGLVVRGDQRGRELGFPTANLQAVPHAAVPADGIYAGWLVRDLASGLGAPRLPAAISIGTNPTFEGNERRIEAYVLDFDGDLYGEAVALDFAGWLRPTEAYDGVGPLVEQIRRDVTEVRRLLV